MTVRSFLEKLTYTFGWRQERCLTFASLTIGLLGQNNVQHHALSQGLTTPGTLKSKLGLLQSLFRV